MDEYCTHNIRGLVEQETDFENTIKDDPITLLDALNRIAHEGALTGSYRCHTIVTQLNRLVTLQMDDNEHPQEWMHRVKAQCDSIAQLLGTKWLKGVVEDDDDYKNATIQADRTALVVKLWDEFQAYIVLHGSHPKKYGQLKKDLKQFAVLNDEKYPKTMEDMKDALTRHPWDPTWNEHKKKHQEQKTHFQHKKKYENDDKEDIALAQGKNNIVCYCCGQVNHRSTDCSKEKSIPKDQWFINTGRQHITNAQQAQQATPTNQPPSNNSDQQVPSNASTANSNTTTSNRRSGRGVFQAFQTEIIQAETEVTNELANAQKTNEVWKHLKDVFLLDSASTCHSIMNSALCESPRVAKIPVNLATNIGTKQIDLETKYLRLEWHNTIPKV